MKLKKILTLSLVSLFTFFSCQKADDKEIVSERFVHKYGFDLTEKEWNSRDQNGQIITVLKNGITKKSEYKSGVLHGVTTYSFPFSSIIQEKIEYNEGSPTKNTTYELNGLPIQEISYSPENKKIITVWDKNGVPVSMEEYDNSLLISARYFNSQNEIENTINGGNGFRIKKDREGKLLSKEVVESGKITKRTTFHPNGEIQSICSFVDYKLNGLQKTFDAAGNPLTQTSWVNGQKDGISTLYREGKPYLETVYKDGKKEGIEKEYNLSGALVKEIHWESDKKHGCSKYYYEGYTDVQWYWKGIAVDLKKYQTMDLKEEFIAEINASTKSKIK